LHQDVFLPPTWAADFAAALDHLNKLDPNWGVLGVWGLTVQGGGVGHVYSTGLQMTLGSPFVTPIPVASLDEVMLVVRRDAGLRFDQDLPGFHLYGTDICLQAEQRGLGCYAVPSFCLHNSNGLHCLPRSFWKAYFYMRRKWRSQLPLQTPCIRISRGLSPVICYGLWKARQLLFERRRAGTRSERPDLIWQELATS
jgi:GT2 family glycosyltransferase